MRIFRYDRYQKAFQDLFESERKRRPGWSTAALAQRILVQPSHITNVIKGRNHFSSDQIYAIGADLGLSEEEVAYLDLLMEWERAEFAARKSQLHAAIQQIRDKKLRAEKELQAEQNRLTPLEAERYYLDPNIELIHLYLGTKRALSDTSEIAALWGLSKDYIAEILSFLEKSGLIVQARNRWTVKPIHQLLPASSPLCKPQQMLKRLRAMETLQKIPASDVYSFSAALTMSEDTRLHIQGKFVEFLREIEKTVVESSSDHVYHIQFDLFPWLPKR